VVRKSITEKEHPSYSLDLASNDFWLFSKIKSALKGRRFQETEDIQQKSDKGTERYSTTGIAKKYFQQWKHCWVSA
jgi:hypothetical protein